MSNEIKFIHACGWEGKIEQLTKVFVSGKLIKVCCPKCVKEIEINNQKTK